MRLRHFLRGAKLPLLLLLIAVLSALTKIGINSFTGLFWHFRREITNYLISNVGNWLAVLYWIAHGVALLCAAVYWTSKFGLQAIGSGRCPALLHRFAACSHVMRQVCLKSRASCRYAAAFMRLSACS